MTEPAAETVSDVAGALVRWLYELMPARGGRRDAMVAAVEAAFGQDHRPATVGAVAELEALGRSFAGHLVLERHDEARRPDALSPGWPLPEPAAVAAVAGGIRRVERIGGTAVITISSLEDFDLARPYVDAALALADGADRVVLDLRGNGGGSPETVAYLVGWVLGRPGSLLSTIVYADGELEWRHADLHGRPVFDGPLDVLVDSSTFSSAEALAYHLQVRGRARVIGEPTRGGGDHVSPIQLTPHVWAMVPSGVVVDAVTGTNWEGSGVQPDVPCPAGTALERALALASPGLA